MNKESSIKKICAEAAGYALWWTRAKQFPPTEVPQTTLKSTSQNPQERRNSLKGSAALLSLRSIEPKRNGVSCIGWQPRVANRQEIGTKILGLTLASLKDRLTL